MERGQTSVSTAEGAVGGARAAALAKARADQLAALEAQKAELAAANAVPELRSMGARFRPQVLDNTAGQVSSALYGLKTREEWVAAQGEAAKRIGLDGVAKEEAESAEALERRRRSEEKQRRKRMREHKKSSKLLSFGDEEEEGEESDREEQGEQQQQQQRQQQQKQQQQHLHDEAAVERREQAEGQQQPPPRQDEPAGDAPPQEREQRTGSEETPASKKAKVSITKDPSVETSFLPDRQREEEERREVTRLKREWILEQERIKNESIEITFSFWDGVGHRRKVSVTKGATVEEFLETVRKSLLKEFGHLRAASADTLMFVKEDLIIPHDVSFYDLIVSKARGKTGPLFNFDVKDDVRLVNDIRVETDNSHAGKVTERHWYERNKHYYPASRWEVLDLAQIMADLRAKGQH